MKIIKNNFIMIKYVMKLVPLYVISSLIYIIASAISSIVDVMVVEKIIYEVIKGDKDINNIINIVLVFVIVNSICILITRLHQNYFIPRFRQQWMKKIQKIMYEKAANLDMSVFDNPKEYDLFNRALREGDSKGINTFDTFVRFIRNVVIMFSLGVYIILKDPFLIIIILVQTIISTIIESKNAKMMYKVNKEQEKQFRRYGYINRIFYLEKYSLDIKTTNVSKLLTQNQDEVRKIIDNNYRFVENKTFVLESIEDIFYQSARYFGGFLYLMSKVYNGILDIAGFTGSINAIIKFTNNLYGIIYSFVSLKENSFYIDDFLWLMEYEPQIEGKGGKTFDTKYPTLSINGLYFNYPNQEELVLNNVNLKINPNEKLAIIGYNGAGKTTLIKLLLKFYNPTEGEIFIDNLNYYDLDERNLRSKYISIFQNFQIYSMTVLENVLFRKRISDEDDIIVWDALEKAGLAEKIRESNDGLDTLLTKEFTKDGLSLSGGERQKLTIARVFASSSPIVILDEPTSALDPVSEYEINNRILNLCKEKTIILISHRLSTVIDANRIVMFADGAIVEEGTHFELMRLKGKYYEMFTTQAKLYVE